MVMRAGPGARLDRHCAGPELLGPDRGAADRCLAVHAWCLRRAGVELVVTNYPDAELAPIGSVAGHCRLRDQVPLVSAAAGPCRYSRNRWNARLGGSRSPGVPRFRRRRRGALRLARLATIVSARTAASSATPSRVADLRLRWNGTPMKCRPEMTVLDPFFCIGKPRSSTAPG